MSDYFVHETSVVDDNVVIGEGTRIWHFSHIHQQRSHRRRLQAAEQRIPL